MSAPPSEEAQAEAILELDKHAMAPGDVMYLISAKWLNTWRQSVGYSTGKPLRLAIPPIDNDCLFDNAGLRQSLTEGDDFFIVSEPVWKLLSAWHGGGPSVAKEAELNPLTGEAQVVVSLPKYIIFCRNACVCLFLSAGGFYYLFL